jgi:hypothetical protein
MIGAAVPDSGIWNMSDILTDYRKWRSQQEDRIGTHSDDCHMWPRHERCMIHRLAAELANSHLVADHLRAALVAVATQGGTLSVSEGRLFVDVGDTEELAFDYATPPTHRTPGEGSVPTKLSENDKPG